MTDDSHQRLLVGRVAGERLQVETLRLHHIPLHHLAKDPVFGEDVRIVGSQRVGVLYVKTNLFLLNTSNNLNCDYRKLD
jgi:hypothetical protein